MSTNAQLAAHLLRGAAKLFRTIAEDDPELQQRLLGFGEVYEKVATHLENDPTGNSAFDEVDAL